MIILKKTCKRFIMLCNMDKVDMFKMHHVKMLDVPGTRYIIVTYKSGYRKFIPYKWDQKEQRDKDAYYLGCYILFSGGYTTETCKGCKHPCIMYEPTMKACDKKGRV